MGDIKRKRSKFKRPKKAFDKARIDAEKIVLKKYGLKNKKEIWRVEADIGKIRRRAKTLIPKSEDEKKEFFGKLNHMGLDVKEIADVLALTKEDLMERRLQTIVLRKKLGKSIKESRQLIVHKRVLVGGNKVNTPSFMVTKDMESKISLVKVQKGSGPKTEKLKEKTLENKENIEEKKE